MSIFQYWLKKNREERDRIAEQWDEIARVGSMPTVGSSRKSAQGSSPDYFGAYPKSTRKRASSSGKPTRRRATRSIPNGIKPKSTRYSFKNAR